MAPGKIAGCQTAVIRHGSSSERKAAAAAFACHGRGERTAPSSTRRRPGAGAPQGLDHPVVDPLAEGVQGPVAGGRQASAFVELVVAQLERRTECDRDPGADLLARIFGQQAQQLLGQLVADLRAVVFGKGLKISHVAIISQMPPG